MPGADNHAQALPFVRRLELLGAIPLLLPVIDVRAPADWGPVRAIYMEGIATGDTTFQRLRFRRGPRCL